MWQGRFSSGEGVFGDVHNARSWSEGWCNLIDGFRIYRTQQVIEVTPLITVCAHTPKHTHGAERKIKRLYVYIVHISASLGELALEEPTANSLPHTHWVMICILQLRNPV